MWDKNHLPVQDMGYARRERLLDDEPATKKRDSRSNL
jgi:hypothetical protein